MQIYFHLVYFSNLIFYLQKPQKLKIFFWRQLFLLVVECLQFKISHHRKEISKALREENTFKTLSLLFLFSKWCLSVLARLFSWPHCTNIGKNKEIKKKKRSILNLPLSIKGMVRVRSMSDCLQGNLIFFCFALLYLHDCMINRAGHDMEPMIYSIYTLLTLNHSGFLWFRNKEVFFCYTGGNHFIHWQLHINTKL